MDLIDPTGFFTSLLAAAVAALLAAVAALRGWQLVMSRLLLYRQPLTAAEGASVATFFQRSGGRASERYPAWFSTDEHYVDAPKLVRGELPRSFRLRGRRAAALRSRIDLPGLARLALAASRNGSAVTLLAEPAMGKTIEMIRLAEHLQRRWRPGLPLPILLFAGDIAFPRDLPTSYNACAAALTRLVIQVLEDTGAPEEFARLLDSRWSLLQPVILIDALDEIADKESYEGTIDFLARAAKGLAKHNTTLVLSCREADYSPRTNLAPVSIEPLSPATIKDHFRKRGVDDSWNARTLVRRGFDEGYLEAAGGLAGYLTNTFFLTLYIQWLLEHRPPYIGELPRPPRHVGELIEKMLVREIARRTPTARPGEVATPEYVSDCLAPVAYELTCASLEKTRTVPPLGSEHALHMLVLDARNPFARQGWRHHLRKLSQSGAQDDVHALWQRGIAVPFELLPGTELGPLDSEKAQVLIATSLSDVRERMPGVDVTLRAILYAGAGVVANWWEAVEWAQAIIGIGRAHAARLLALDRQGVPKRFMHQRVREYLAARFIDHEQIAEYVRFDFRRNAWWQQTLNMVAATSQAPHAVLGLLLERVTRDRWYLLAAAESLSFVPRDRRGTCELQAREIEQGLRSMAAGAPSEDALGRFLAGRSLAVLVCSQIVTSDDELLREFQEMALHPGRRSAVVLALAHLATDRGASWANRGRAGQSLLVAMAAEKEVADVVAMSHYGRRGDVVRLVRCLAAMLRGATVATWIGATGGFVLELAQMQGLPSGGWIAVGVTAALVGGHRAYVSGDFVETALEGLRAGKRLSRPLVRVFSAVCRGFVIVAGLCFVLPWGVLQRSVKWALAMLGVKGAWNSGPTRRQRAPVRWGVITACAMIGSAVLMGAISLPGRLPPPRATEAKPANGQAPPPSVPSVAVATLVREAANLHEEARGLRSAPEWPPARDALGRRMDVLLRRVNASRAQLEGLVGDLARGDAATGRAYLGETERLIAEGRAWLLKSEVRAQLGALLAEAIETCRNAAWREASESALSRVRSLRSEEEAWSEEFVARSSGGSLEMERGALMRTQEARAAAEAVCAERVRAGLYSAEEARKVAAMLRSRINAVASERVSLDRHLRGDAPVGEPLVKWAIATRGACERLTRSSLELHEVDNAADRLEGAVGKELQRDVEDVRLAARAERNAVSVKCGEAEVKLRTARQRLEAWAADYMMQARYAAAVLLRIGREAGSVGEEAGAHVAECTRLMTSLAQGLEEGYAVLLPRARTVDSEVRRLRVLAERLKTRYRVLGSAQVIGRVKLADLSVERAVMGWPAAFGGSIDRDGVRASLRAALEECERADAIAVAAVQRSEQALSEVGELRNGPVRRAVIVGQGVRVLAILVALGLLVVPYGLVMKLRARGRLVPLDEQANRGDHSATRECALRLVESERLMDVRLEALRHLTDLALSTEDEVARLARVAARLQDRGRRGDLACAGRLLRIAADGEARRMRAS